MITQLWPKYRPIALLVLLAAGVGFPLVFSDPFVTSIAVLTLIYAGAATSWNIFSGYTRYIALGHAVFFGVGAYALAIMCQRWHITSDFGPLVFLPLCGLFAVIVAVPLGAIALRARSHTFVVITIAMVFIAQLLAYNLSDLTQGSKGLELPIPSWTFDVYNLPFYYGGLIILLLALATSWWIRRSKFGLGLLAIRDDEDRALGLGVRTGPSKLLAFVISASFVGMLGGLWAYYLESIYPQYAFSPLFDVTVALAGFLGGIGTLSGPVVGALIIIPAQQLLASNKELSPWYLPLYGGVFLVVILLLPEGIIPTVRKRWAQWNVRRDTAQPSPGGTPPEPSRPAVAVRGEGGSR